MAFGGGSTCWCNPSGMGLRDSKGGSGCGAASCCLAAASQGVLRCHLGHDRGIFEDLRFWNRLADQLRRRRRRHDRPDAERNDRDLSVPATRPRRSNSALPPLAQCARTAPPIISSHFAARTALICWPLASLRKRGRKPSSGKRPPRHPAGLFNHRGSA